MKAILKKKIFTSSGQNANVTLLPSQSSFCGEERPAREVRKARGRPGECKRKEGLHGRRKDSWKQKIPVFREAGRELIKHRSK